MIVSPNQRSDLEVAHWLTHVMRASCTCLARVREVRAEHGQLTCHACGSVLVPVAPARRRGGRR